MAGPSCTFPGRERLQKFLARSGSVSRRAGEEAILAGRVLVNGQVVRRLGTRVDPDNDVVQLDGHAVRPWPKLYVALNKPPGYVCSKRRQGRHRLVGDLLPSEWAGLHPVGRLDRDSEGLLFLSNDGDFALRLSHPRFGTPKTYLATVSGRITREVLDRFIRGVPCDGELLRAQRVRLVSANDARSYVELTLVEGRNREVRRLFASQGYVVTRLIRTRVGSIRLGELATGRWRVLAPAEVKSLMENGSVDVPVSP